MKRHKSLLFSIIAILLFTANFMFPATAQEPKPELNLNDKSIVHNFYSDYFGIKRDEIDNLSKSVSEKDLPIALFIAAKTKLSPENVISQRKSGLPWLSVLQRLGLSPTVLYIDLPPGTGVEPPFGKAYGYYRNHKKGIKTKFNLNDQDIFYLVNLKILSDCGMSPQEIINLITTGQSFFRIIADNYNVKLKVKAQVKVKDKETSKDKPGKSSNNGKDKPGKPEKNKGKKPEMDSGNK